MNAKRFLPAVLLALIAFAPLGLDGEPKSGVTPAELETVLRTRSEFHAAILAQQDASAAALHAAVNAFLVVDKKPRCTAKERQAAVEALQSAMEALKAVETKLSAATDAEQKSLETVLKALQ